MPDVLYKLLRFDGALERDPAVNAWLEARPAGFVAIVRPWFDQMRALGADVRECIHDGCPVACVEDAPFAYVNVFTAHAAVGFFHGASLPDPACVLQGAGRYMRHVKLRLGHPIDRTALEALLGAAHRDIHVRLEHERAHG